MTRRFNIAYRKAGRRGPKAAPLKLLHWERGRPNIRACPQTSLQRPKQGPPNTERMQGDPPRLLPEDVTVTPP